MIQTVLGSIRPDQLGVTSAHEHLLIDMRNCVSPPDNPGAVYFAPFSTYLRAEVYDDPYAVLDNSLLADIPDAIAELSDFKFWGGSTVIDCTLDEIGRDPLALREISQKSGVNIIMGCGHYYEKAHYHTVADASVEDLAQELRNDLLLGVGETGIRAGIIGEIGTSAQITTNEKKVLTAAGTVSAETGIPIHVHTDLYTENGCAIADLLTNLGALAGKICIDHTDVLLRPDYLRRLLDKGVYIGFDNFGKEFPISPERRFALDLERVRILKRLIDEGYEKQLLISNDICLKSMWRKYGGLGYAHILRGIRKIALDIGISQDSYNRLLTDNVKSFLC